MNKKLFGATLFVLYFSTCNFVQSMKNVVVFENQNCCIKVSMLEWWQKFSFRHKWYDQERKNIELPPIPDGFTPEIIIDPRYNNDTSVCFRCNTCKTIIYYTEMYGLLKKRENSEKGRKSYNGCQNCYTDLYFYFEKNWNKK